jgi:DNA-binding transcriptional LysR family regulator
MGEERWSSAAKPDKPISRTPNGEISRRLALAGQGVTRLSLFHIRPDIKAGRLVPMLEAYNPGDVEEVNVVYVGHGGRLPARVRALIDFLAKEVDLDDALELLDTI